MADAVGGTLTAANACTARDAEFINADYKVVGWHRIRWLMPDDVTPIGPRIKGKPANMANPPAEAIYDISGSARSIDSAGITIDWGP